MAFVERILLLSLAGVVVLEYTTFCRAAPDPFSSTVDLALSQGALVVLVAVQVSVTGFYLPPVLNAFTLDNDLLR